MKITKLTFGLVWELNDYVTESFKTNPPEFFYCVCDEYDVLTYGRDNYQQMVRDGGKISLWVLKSKFSSLADNQKDKIRFFHFETE